MSPSLGKYLFLLRLSGTLAVKAFRTRLSGSIIPDVLIIELTSACDLSCRACYIPKSGPTRTLSGKLVRQLLSEAVAIGIPHVSFSGGEPLLQSETIVHCLAENPGTSFSIATSGFLLSREFVASLAGFPNVQLILSTDGPVASARFRHPDSSRRFVEAATLLRNAGIRYGASTRVYGENFGEVVSPAFLSFLTDNGCAFGAFSPLLPYAREAGALAPLTPAERACLDRFCIQARQFSSLEIIAPCLGPGPCAGGGRIISVTPEGWILPCPHIPWKCHRFPDHTLKEALESNFFTELRRASPGKAGSCCFLLDHNDRLKEIINRNTASSVACR